MTRLICEFASSHNADLEMAKAMIDSVAQNAPGSICKFQSWSAANVALDDPDRARYEKYQFPDVWYEALIPYCAERGVEFMTSVFNADRCKYLAGLGLKKVKIASVSLTNTELLMQAGLYFDEVLLSTGAHSKAEIEDAADVLASSAKKFTLLACTVEYPCPVEHAGLNRIDTLKEIVQGQAYAQVGYSNHCLDVDSSKAAIAKGISYLEVHLTLCRFLPQTPHQMFEGGPLITTHQVAIEPHELREIANFRDKCEMMNNGEFATSETERKIFERYKTRYGK